MCNKVLLCLCFCLHLVVLLNDKYRLLTPAGLEYYFFPEHCTSNKNFSEGTIMYVLSYLIVYLILSTQLAVVHPVCLSATVLVQIKVITGARGSIFHGSLFCL